MSHLSTNERERLQRLSHEVREVFSERAHRIGEALGQDPAFGDGELGRSALARLLMRSALTIATSQLDLGLVGGPGGSKSVQSFDGRYDRRYRVLGAEKRSDGNYLILSSSDAVLHIDGDSLYFEEAWVLGYTLSVDNQIDEMFVAQIHDRIEGNPGELILGPAYMLISQPTDYSGFVPTDDNDLLDLDEDDLGEDLPGFG